MACISALYKGVCVAHQLSVAVSIPPDQAAQCRSVYRSSAQTDCAGTGWTHGACSTSLLPPPPSLQTSPTWTTAQGQIEDMSWRHQMSWKLKMTNVESGIRSTLTENTDCTQTFSSSNIQYLTHSVPQTISSYAIQ